MVATSVVLGLSILFEEGGGLSLLRYLDVLGHDMLRGAVTCSSIFCMAGGKRNRLKCSLLFVGRGLLDVFLAVWDGAKRTSHGTPTHIKTMELDFRCMSRASLRLFTAKQKAALRACPGGSFCYHFVRKWPTLKMESFTTRGVDQLSTKGGNKTPGKRLVGPSWVELFIRQILCRSMTLGQVRLLFVVRTVLRVVPKERANQAESQQSK